MKESDVLTSSNRTVAVYKGQKVAVYTVDKTEISLTRQDLVELVNVCSSLFINLLSVLSRIVQSTNTYVVQLA